MDKTFKIREEEYIQFRKIAKEEDRSMAAVFRRMLALYIDHRAKNLGNG